MEKMSQVVDFVIKTSKFCNMRCRYCYEFPDLGNPESISMAAMENIYCHIAAYYQELDQPTQINFIWHGGEPLVQPPEFYWQNFTHQQKIFGDTKVLVKNYVQTNLTVLNPERIELLKNGFDSVGVSVDLFGGLRVNQAGKDTLPVVLKNMDLLREHEIDYGCITVLTQRNVHHLKEIFDFYERMGLSFRILPLFKGAYEDQHMGFELSPEEVLNAFKDLTDMWFESRDIVVMQPILSHVEEVLRHHHPNSQPHFYDKRQWESILMVNTNGDLFTYAEAYSGQKIGNLIEQPLGELIHCKAHLNVIEAAEKRLKQTCYHCKFFGSCGGYPVAEGSSEYNEYDETGAIRCIVPQGTLNHIELRLQEGGFLNRETGAFILDQATQVENSALNCAF